MAFLRRLLMLAAFALCAGGPVAAANPPGLPAGWSHAQINVVGANGRPHTLIYDRGRVTAVGASSLTLREPDGSIVTIQVAAAAVIRLNGRAATFAQIQPGFLVQTLGVDGNPARRVQATARPAARTAAQRLRAVRRR